MIKILFICHGRDMLGMEKVLKIRDFLCFLCSFTKDLPIWGGGESDSRKLRLE